MTENTAAMIDEFTRQLKLTPEYVHYEKKRAIVSSDSERWKKANEYRKARFHLMHDNPDPYEMLETFERENEHLHWDQIIEDYLEAEVAVCRLVQEVYVKIFAAIDIDIDDT